MMVVSRISLMKTLADRSFSFCSLSKTLEYLVHALKFPNSHVCGPQFYLALATSHYKTCSLVVRKLKILVIVIFF